MIIDGQEVGEDEEGNIITWIKTPFMSAGMKYGFPNNCIGISLNEKIVELAEKEQKIIHIVFGDTYDKKRHYTIIPRRIREIVAEYNSVYYKGNIKLLVFPVKEMRPLSGIGHG
jgi:hypothetical protein